MDDSRYQTWHADAELLAEIGRHLFAQDHKINVRLPTNLAEKALASWHRDDPDTDLPVDETESQRSDRHRAATLALIGLSIDQEGITGSAEVMVELSAWYVGLALEAADERGLLGDAAPPRR